MSFAFFDEVQTPVHFSSAYFLCLICRLSFRMVSRIVDMAFSSTRIRDSRRLKRVSSSDRRTKLDVSTAWAGALGAEAGDGYGKLLPKGPARPAIGGMDVSTGIA